MQPVRLRLASSNPGKLAEFRALSTAAAAGFAFEPLPGFANLPEFQESAPTFAENALGKALYYSRHVADPVVSDDSGLVVPALNGRPGVHSARYAGPGATAAQRNAKLLEELRGYTGAGRSAYFVCVIALARQGKALAVVSDRVDGSVLESPVGEGGFGYDPVFLFPPLGKAFAEFAPEEKNRHSHRGKAFLRLLPVLGAVL